MKRNRRGRSVARQTGPCRDELEDALRVAVGEVQGDRSADGDADEMKAVDAELVRELTDELAVAIDGGRFFESMRAAESGQVRRDRVVAAAKFRQDVAEHPG